MGIYEQPLYYDIAFGFIDPREQVDNFEKIIATFSHRKVKRVLDIACGTSLQLREFARRGYEAVGLDASPEMLTYLAQKAEEEGLPIDTIHADMCAFCLAKRVDLAFIMMGSLAVASNARFLQHLESVAKVLNKGGLYFV